MKKQIENILIKVDEGTMPVQHALSNILILLNANGLVCDECGDGSGWYGDDELPEFGSINMNCSKCNTLAI
jgi:hypothetical protein